MDVELTLARHIAARALVVGPVAVAIAWLLRGPEGGLAAAIGVAIVVANFLLSGWLLSRALKISLSVYHAAALFGFVLRLALIALAMLAAAALLEVDRYAMGFAAVGSYLVLITLEALAMTRNTEKEPEWSN
ncbi:MAG: hypothetical protein KJ698_12695 [Actinobacteria bacterium]|nr:hypothetical protein [Actinomycetota bacterium]MBU1493829.1 hypothetical protein [Actinomycetota bacterium]